ncbi:hypothetical protein [Hymenobacter sp. BRD67]|uniref:hypothetical protein n=1 Tax=Hymenobacter sp. BRD67 TaxID=2675877 RepID=UPI0015662E8D|nr:hypothetical protein [Hymenobacter sp. BRD67]QKG52724.1 hypothetical protein GKZ67_09060 [Hymenobacter sp. BRD67]
MSPDSKIRQIFLPFLGIVLSVLSSFFIVDWWMNKRASDAISALWISVLPITVAVVLVAVFLHPQLKYLKYSTQRGASTKEGGNTVLLYFLPVLLIGVESWRLDDYLGNKLAGITALNTIEEIEKYPPTRFYLLKQRYLDTSAIGCDSAIVHQKNTRLLLFLI